jgi:hypothetical protein
MWKEDLMADRSFKWALVTMYDLRNHGTWEMEMKRAVSPTLSSLPHL